MKIFKCICGYTTNKNGAIGRHKGMCKTHKEKLKDIVSDRKKIIDLYLHTYSVSKVLETLKVDDCFVIQRGHIVKILKEENVYEGLKGENYIKNKVEKQKQLMLERYGVENISQHPTKGGGYTKQNSIPYNKIPFFKDEYISYRKKVEELTNKNIRKHFKNNLPTHCEYTNVEFTDVSKKSNPNDPLKRTVDHRVSVSNCYLLGKSVEECSDILNISFCLRIVNTLKQNQNIEHFQPMLQKIKEVLINEGCKIRETN